MVDMNWAPRSEFILAGTPNLEIQPEMRALAQSDTEMEDRGTDSGKPKVLLRMVNRKVNPVELGRGPTRSTWMWENLLAGTGT